MTNTDRIERTILLSAPKSRVWRALTDAREFGEWFGVKLEGPFEVGKPTRGRLAIKGYDHLTLEIIIERMDAEDVFAYRWHPYAVDPNVDYSTEPTTLVEFRLDQVDDGVKLTVVESGFDRIPAHRRDEAFRMNEKGWAGQIENIRRHVAG